MDEAERDIEEARTYTMEEVRQHFKELFDNELDRDPKDNIIDNPPKWSKNTKNLPSKYVDMINEVIMKDARQEAIRIMELAPNSEREELKKHYQDDHNIFCMHLDSTKYILCRNNIMQWRKGDYFGEPWFTLEKEGNQ